MKCWLAVASADHVSIGRAAGFMQVCHGKCKPLQRMRPGDLVVYYSPSQVMGVKDGLMQFTAIGQVREGIPYQADMGGGFHPFRRDVDWFPSVQAAIRPLLDRLSFSAGKPGWGYMLRFGLVEIAQSDMQVIAQAMAVEPDYAGSLWPDALSAAA
ncbi:EVE domain-containing protein [Burkholderiaceae bacterium DAT-1]|nr:EVE domain-containing protein [Burkholderiaceae bacterium DAT-1]